MEVASDLYFWNSGNRDLAVEDYLHFGGSQLFWDVSLGVCSRIGNWSK